MLLHWVKSVPQIHQLPWDPAGTPVLALPFLFFGPHLSLICFFWSLEAMALSLSRHGWRSECSALVSSSVRQRKQKFRWGLCVLTASMWVQALTGQAAVCFPVCVSLGSESSRELHECSKARARALSSHPLSRECLAFRGYYYMKG